MDPQRKAYLQLHISVFLWGFTAILGKLISVNEMALVWYRLFITCLSLLLLPKLLAELRKMTKNELIKLAAVGCLVALHWVCFYGAIKYSNVSIALSCLATTSFMTSILEPLITRSKPKFYELALGFLIIPGIYLIFYFTEFYYLTGIVLGLMAALLAAIFPVLNKIFVEKHEPRAMTFVELGSGMIFLTLLMPFYFYFFPETNFIPDSNDWIYLLILAIGCTTLPFVLALRALKQLSAFAATLAVNLEPIYGIIMAMFIFNENKNLDNRVYLGTLIILSAVFLHPVLKRVFDRKKLG